jgi:hypothetical protein
MLLHMDNTGRNKIQLSQRISDQNQKKNQILNQLPRHDRMGNISRYCPFNVSTKNTLTTKTMRNYL